MIREAFRWGLVGVCAACVALIGALVTRAQPQQNGNGGPQNGPPPVYQRHSGDRGPNWNDRWRNKRFQPSPWIAPQVQSGWFQRPYPYHLDYYKMRWGGSYAPYFGNLYGTPFGTPQVVNGGWGVGGVEPGAGGWGAEPGVQSQGVEGSVWTPYALPPGAVMGQPGPAAESNNQGGAVGQGSERLPAPSK